MKNKKINKTCHNNNKRINENTYARLSNAGNAFQCKKELENYLLILMNDIRIENLII